MSLMLVNEQKLSKVGLIAFFEANRPVWRGSMQKTYSFVKDAFPPDAIIRRDDVAKELLNVIEVNDQLGNFLAAERLSQRYWFAHFTDLIVDRCWAEVTAPQNP